MGKKSTKINFTAQLGFEGKDDFMLKFSDGRIYPWPTEEESKQYEKQYPMPTIKQMEEYYKANPGIKEKVEDFIQKQKKKNY